MKIETVENLPNVAPGRPSIYPFSELKPSQKLTITLVYGEPLYKIHNRVKSALYQYKKTNGLDWVTAIRIENNQVVVYRIS